jgi:hypothetical protein
MAIDRTMAASEAGEDWRGTKIPLLAALLAYMSAYDPLDDRHTGLPATLAEVAILPADVFSIPVERFLDATVERTSFAAEAAFDKGLR